MKKISMRKILYYFLIIIGICVLKVPYMASIASDNYSDFVRYILIFWGSNQLVNLIWLLPILFSMYIVAKKYFYKMQHFEVRLKNRKHFINIALIKCCLVSIIFNILIALLQIVILSLISKTSIIINGNVFNTIIQYTIENTFLNVIIILCAMYIKNFIYSYSVFVILIIISLTAIINLALVKESIYLPFINLYFNDKISLTTILLTIIIIFLIKRS